MEVFDWLATVPESVKNEHPSLWIKSASFSLICGLSEGVEEQLQSAERALRGREDSEQLLFGQISTDRATLAVSQYRIEDAKIHGKRALQLLAGDFSTFRLAALWDLGMAYHFSGNRAEARRIFEEVFSSSHSAGAITFEILSALGLGETQENNNQLFLAAETFLHVLHISGEHPQPSVCEAYQGLARIHYEWNDLEKAEMYGEQGLILARQYDSAVDRFLLCEIFLARLEMGKGNMDTAEKRLAQIEQTALKNRFLHRIPEIQKAQAFLHLRMGRMPESAGLPPPLQIRILLAKGQFEAAAGLLDSWTTQVQDQVDERLRALVLRAVVQELIGNHETALEALESSLKLAEPGGFLRLFIDEGSVMRKLVQEVYERGKLPEYANRILTAFTKANTETLKHTEMETAQKNHGLLSAREFEILLRLAEGLSNQDIAEILFISLHTVKVHVRNIFAKLETSSRTSAVAKARSLGILL